MIVRKVLILFFIVTGFIFTSSLTMFIISKSFRECVTKNIIKITWPEKLEGAFCANFFQVSHGKNVACSENMFSKMGALLDSYDSTGGTPEIKAELQELQTHLKEYYKNLKTFNVPQKKLRSVAYQIKCIQTIVNT